MGKLLNEFKEFAVKGNAVDMAVAVVIGGAFGAMFGSWMGLGATSYGVTGIPGYLIINKPLPYTILLAISGGIAFLLTYFFWNEDEKAFASSTASVFSGRALALAGFGGLILGLAGATLVLRPRRKKEEEAA